VALVNHVTYLTPDIVPFLEALGVAGSRRVLLTVNDPPPPSRHGVLYELLHGEKEEVVPGHAELTAVLREMGIRPEVRNLPDATVRQAAAPTREAAVQSAMSLAPGAQWAWWPLSDAQSKKLRDIVETRFDDLFEQTPDGYRGKWAATGHEVLITWPTG
jgi:hypothetical protein